MGQEQIDVLVPEMLKLLSPVVELAKLYNNAYPLDSTHSDVIDAVRVPVPMRVFMILAGLAVNLCVVAKEKEATAVVVDDGPADTQG